MPATSPAQQRLMGMSLAYKRGELKNPSAEVKKVSRSMSEHQLHVFAATKGLAFGGIPKIGIGHPGIKLMDAPKMESVKPVQLGATIKSMGRGIGHFQDGGSVDDSQIIPDFNFNAGLIPGSGAGRTDRIPMSIPSESHIMTADTISGLGQGSTPAGARILTQALRVGPYGVPYPHAIHGKGPPKPPPINHELFHMAQGGHAVTVGDKPHRVSVLVASGEFAIPEDDWIAKDHVDGKLYLHKGVKSVGDGDTKQGHKRLDDLMRRVREFNIDWLKHAPKPKR